MRNESQKETYELVRRWASWVQRGGGGAQGFSSTSVSYRLAEQKRSGVRYEPGFISNYLDPELAAVETVMIHMPHRLKRVLNAEFFVYGPVEVRARKLGLKKRHFYTMLDSALLVVAARLANAQPNESIC